MGNDSFDEQLAAVAESYPGAARLAIPERRLIRIPALTMSGAWTPGTIRGLLICDSWPNERPQLLVGDELRRDGTQPVNFSPQLVGDEAWFGFSFNAPYSVENPALIPVIRGWLGRFDGRSD
jgi:hypothetical protein